MVPRVQTFAWRLLRRAIPIGMRAGKFSSHIIKQCARCDQEENDIHIFFTCLFAKAAWFSEPWNIRSEFFVQNFGSIPAIIQALLTSNHPHASLNNIITFLWCIWKFRNDNLFGRKSNSPMQVYPAMQAIIKSQELVSCANIAGSPTEIAHKPKQGCSLETDAWITGCKVYTDAAWKKNTTASKNDSSKTGIGIVIQAGENEQGTGILISASCGSVESPLQAEATALQVAAQIASHITSSQVTFLVDNLTLAQAAASRNLIQLPGHWEIRSHLANFFGATANIQAKVFHIPRKLNVKAHNCAALSYREDHPPSNKFACCKVEHTGGHCPTLAKLGSLCIKDCQILYVTCI